MQKEQEEQVLEEKPLGSQPGGLVSTLLKGCCDLYGALWLLFVSFWKPLGWDRNTGPSRRLRVNCCSAKSCLEPPVIFKILLDSAFEGFWEVFKCLKCLFLFPPFCVSKFTSFKDTCSTKFFARFQPILLSVCSVFFAKSQIGRFSVGVDRQTVPRFALQPYLNPELASPPPTLPPHTGVTWSQDNRMTWQEKNTTLVELLGVLCTFLLGR